MSRAWPRDAVEFASSVRATLAGLGGSDLAREVEHQPELRTSRVLPALAATGLTELDAFGEDDEAAAALLGVRACGAVAAPLGVARALSVPSGLKDRADALYVVGRTIDHLEHADLFDQPFAVSVPELSGHRVRATGPVRWAPLDPFGVPVKLTDEPVDVGADVVATAFVLDAYWVLGALDTITHQAAAYATTRTQFGRSIGQFGEIRWRLADIVVARDGLDELARQTWLLCRSGAVSTADALALRCGMIDAASVALSNGHQVFGAIGLCEEHDMALLDRHLTPTLVRPVAATATAELLAHAIDEHGFDAIFAIAPWRNS